MIRTLLQAGVTDALHLRMFLQITSDAKRIRYVPLHAQRQRLETEEKEESIEQTHNPTQVAQQLGSQLHQVPVHSEGFVERKTMICRRRIGNNRVAAIGPVELAGVYHDTADTGAVSADK